MRTSIRNLIHASLILTLALVGCSSSSGTTGSQDAGPAGDAGSSNTSDAGPAYDAGPPSDGTLPAWLQDAGLDTWVEIPNTSGAGGAPIDAYSGLAIKPSTSELIIAAAGGHDDSSDNRTVSIRLDADAPQWVLRHAPSPVDQGDVAYEPDGQPGSMHTYQSENYSAKVEKVMRVRPRYTWPNATDINTNDGFNLSTDTWDGQGVNPLATTGFGFVADGDGNIWTNAWERYDPLAKQWTTPITTFSNDQVRFPGAYDSKRRQIFTLQWADGQGYGTGLSASRVPVDGATQFHVDFAPSAALDQLEADQPTYAGMDYDPLNDEFLFYSGWSCPAGGTCTPVPERVYAITPADSGPWTVSIKALSGAPAPVAQAGVHNRFRYVPALKGFVVLPSSSANLWFFRTH